MNLDDILNSFTKRVDDLARYWDAFSSSPDFMRTDEEEITTLKKKLDSVQEQNAAIMIDLEHIKKILALDEFAPNNLFTLLNTGADQLQVPSTPFIEHYRPPNTPQSEGSQSYQHQSISKRLSHQFAHHLSSAPPLRQPSHTMSELPFGSALENPPLRKQGTEPSFIMPVHLEAKDSAEPLSGDEAMVGGYSLEGNEKEISPRDTSGHHFMVESGSSSMLNRDPVRDLPVIDSKEIENYDLQIIDNPRSVAEVYHEYETSLKSQIEEFERLFGKGQLSKLPKIRTYQRRRALVTEIDKYATTYNKSTHDAIEFFERVRKARKRTVPGLYNNLGKILKELGESHMEDL